jgi:hypothetical protein
MHAVLRGEGWSCAAKNRAILRTGSTAVSKDDQPDRNANAGRRDPEEEPTAPIIPPITPPPAGQTESPHDFTERRMRELRKAQTKNKED